MNQRKSNCDNDAVGGGIYPHYRLCRRIVVELDQAFCAFERNALRIISGSNLAGILRVLNTEAVQKRDQPAIGDDDEYSMFFAPGDQWL